MFQQGWAKDSSFESLTQYVNLALKSGFGVGLYGFDPLVLDLDGERNALSCVANDNMTICWRAA